MRTDSHKSTEAHRIVKDALLEGRSIYQAMLRGGYSEKQARKGRAAIPEAVYALMTREEFLAYRDMGQAILQDRKRLEHCILGFLYACMTTRQERGVRAAELLGRHTRVLTFAEDTRMSERPLLIKTPMSRASTLKMSMRE